MKKYFVLLLLVGSLISCESASTVKETEQDSIDAVDVTIKDSITVDTTLSSLGDSLKADINQAATKLKQHSKELGEVAKQKANEGVDRLKEGAQKIKDAAKASVDAAKKELKK